MLGAVVGKALEPLPLREGVIQVLLTLQSELRWRDGPLGESAQQTFHRLPSTVNQDLLPPLNQSFVTPWHVEAASFHTVQLICLLSSPRVKPFRNVTSSSAIETLKM